MIWYLILLTEGGCGGRGVGFGVSGNVTFQLSTGKSVCGSHSYANEQSCLSVKGANSTTWNTAGWINPSKYFKTNKQTLPYIHKQHQDKHLYQVFYIRHRIGSLPHQWDLCH